MEIRGQRPVQHNSQQAAVVNHKQETDCGSRNCMRHANQSVRIYRRVSSPPVCIHCVYLCLYCLYISAEFFILSDDRLLSLYCQCLCIFIESLLSLEWKSGRIYQLKRLRNFQVFLYCGIE